MPVEMSNGILAPFFRAALPGPVSLPLVFITHSVATRGTGRWHRPAFWISNFV